MEVALVGMVSGAGDGHGRRCALVEPAGIEAAVPGGRRVRRAAAGGVRRADDAAQYLDLAARLMGDAEWDSENARAVLSALIGGEG